MIEELLNAESGASDSWKKVQEARAKITDLVRANEWKVPEHLADVISLKRNRKKLRKENDKIKQLYESLDIVTRQLMEDHKSEVYDIDCAIQALRLRRDAILRPGVVLEIEQQINEAEEEAMLEQEPTIVFKRTKYEAPS